MSNARTNRGNGMPVRRKVWFAVTAVMLVILLAANTVLPMTLSGFMDAYFGGERQIKSGSNEYYIADAGADTKESVLAAANTLVETICGEGIVLLKNDENALPLNSAARVTVFGSNSINLVYGSSGSVGGDTASAPTLYDSLTAAGLVCNPVMRTAYETSGARRPDSPSMGFSGSVPTGFATGEAGLSVYTDAVRASWMTSPTAMIPCWIMTMPPIFRLPCRWACPGSRV